MKRIILLVDAAADFPYPELQDQTPLQVARMPAANALAAEGSCGVLQRSRREADASRALLAESCGLSKAEALRLRWGPIAAAALGISPTPGRVQMLGRFITHTADGEQSPVQPSSESEEQRIYRDLEQAFSACCQDEVHLWRLGRGRFVLDLPPEVSPPEKDRVGWNRLGILRRQSTPFRNILKTAEELLAQHPVNAVRLDLGENPIHGVWLWSGGNAAPAPTPLPFRQALASPDPLAEGWARVRGLPFFRIDDPFTLDQPDAGFDVAAMRALLAEIDELVFWVPAPFATEQFTEPQEKVRRLDAIDYYITGPLRMLLDELRPYRLLVVAAGLRHRGRPEKGPVPFLLCGEGVVADDTSAWNEAEGLRGSLAAPSFARLLRTFRA